MRTRARTGGVGPKEADSLAFGGHPQGAGRVGVMDPLSKASLSLSKETVTVQGSSWILKKLSPLSKTL